MTTNTGLQPVSHFELTLADGEQGIAPLVATLVNAMVNIEFFDVDGVPVTGATAGLLTIFGKYNNGKAIPVGAIDLSTTYQYQVDGKYTDLIFNLTGLTGAATININVDQNENLVVASQGGGTGSGATSIIVTSPDSTIQQVGASAYNPNTQQLSVQLQAAGTAAGTVTRVSSTNADIAVTNQTTTPTLTLNSTVDGAANKIVKLNGDGQLGAIDIGTNGLVNGGSGYSGALNTVFASIIDALSGKQDIVNGATNNNIASLVNGQVVDSGVAVSDLVTQAVTQITFGGNTAFGAITFAGSAVSYNPATKTFTFTGGGGGAGIETIETPDGNSVTANIVSFANGANMNIRSNPITNVITFESTAPASNTYSVQGGAISRVNGGTGGGAIALVAGMADNPTIECFGFTTAAEWSVNLGNVVGITPTTSISVSMTAPVIAAQSLATTQNLQLAYTVYALANGTLIPLATGNTNTASLPQNGVANLTITPTTPAVAGYATTQLIVSFTATTAGASQSAYGIPCFDFAVTLS